MSVERQVGRRGRAAGIHYQRKYLGRFFISRQRISAMSRAAAVLGVAILPNNTVDFIDGHQGVAGRALTMLQTHDIGPEVTS
jgi:hypothetical protein